MRQFLLACLLAVSSLTALSVAAPSARAQSVTTQNISVDRSSAVVGGTIVLSGRGFTPNNWVYVYWQRPDRTTNGAWIFSHPDGSFSFTLGFHAAHGTGVEYINTYNSASNCWTGWISLGVVSSIPTTYARLSATPNPVSLPSPTEKFTAQSLVTGHNFTPNNRVYVSWQRPDGTGDATWLSTDSTGTFSFTLEFLPAHHCGTETLQAYDHATGRWSAPYTITVHCGM